MDQETHIEPLTELPLRGHGSCRDFYRPLDPQRSLIIIDQVYPSPSCQESIHELLLGLQRSGKLNLVLVEGAEGTVPLLEANRARSIKDLTHDPTVVVSPGVVRFLEQPGAQVLGVDSQELMELHWQVVRISNQWEQHWQDLSQKVLVHLERARLLLYPEDMTWLYRSFAADSQLPLTDRASGLVRVARNVGLDLDHFPMFKRFLAAVAAERALDFGVVQRERAEYVRVLVQRLGGWWDKQRGRPAVPFEQTRAALEIWLSETGRVVEGLELPGGLERVLEECSEWLLKRVVDRSLKYRMGEVAHGPYYSEVINVGLRLNVDVFRFPSLLAYLRYVEIASLSPSSLMDELDVLVSATMDRLSDDPRVRTLRVLDEEFRLLARAGRRELTPKEANRFYADVTWPNLIKRLSQLVPEALDVAVGEWADEATRAAYEYCRVSGRRQKVMLNAALEQLSTGNVATAALVCGGFHSLPIAQILREDRPDIGWSRITPKLDMSDVPAKAMST